jgi:hypothetical protein
MISGNKFIGGDPMATNEYRKDEQWEKIEHSLPETPGRGEVDYLLLNGKFWKIQVLDKINGAYFTDNFTEIKLLS